ncbi:GNAT family N-acetyltransferase [Paenibacillus sp. NPDC056579]|uniref:GNAT family N-acetyltransferase n=1 Tax=unclassified Paenibacillus TaxID=185978 RepID=UPI001EF7E99C|nr:GNAT family N-acetyltransferase [Paenibacillus sp. H1-7]ULL16636.1 GNAT family N-acetyltransferase [Paenibacillus sp. H1-7]
MLLRRFHETDIDQIITLFYETVHTINKQDYTQEQVNAWASPADMKQRKEVWLKALTTNISYVAEMNGYIAGFSDMSPQGYLDRLFVHKEHQGQGIASALVDTLEYEGKKLGLIDIETDSSITARPFFERKGYILVKSQIVERNNTQLMNFRMKKSLL